MYMYATASDTAAESQWAALTPEQTNKNDLNTVSMVPVFFFFQQMSFDREKSETKPTASILKKRKERRSKHKQLICVKTKNKNAFLVFD